MRGEVPALAGLLQPSEGLTLPCRGLQDAGSSSLSRAMLAPEPGSVAMVTMARPDGYVHRGSV